MANLASFPRQYARTQRFTLGSPRSFTVAPDGSRVVFLRSSAGDDPRLRLWTIDVGADGCVEREVVDPVTVLAADREDLSDEERARRERSRESAAGIVAYATDLEVGAAAFALSGRLFVASLVDDSVTELPTPTPVIDPRLSPDGRRIAYVCGDDLRVIAADGSDDRAVARAEGEETTIGLAEFVAAEEFGRARGHWWSPDGDRLLAARVDESPVQRWWISDPSDPAAAPRAVRYPAAGTDNAEVSLELIDLDGSTTDVEWDRRAFPYLVDVIWREASQPLVYVMSRSQQRAAILRVDPHTGATSSAVEHSHPAWVERVQGSPALTPKGRLVYAEEHGDARVIVVDGSPVTGSEMQVRAIWGVDDDSVTFAASAGPDAADAEVGQIHVCRVSLDQPSAVTRLSSQPGLHLAACGGDVVVLTSATRERAAPTFRVQRNGSTVAEIASHALEPELPLRLEVVEAGERRIPAAVLLPSGYDPSDGLLPVLVGSYAGPQITSVVDCRRPNLAEQWLAEQGFAVLVIDGRGTPGRSLAWEKAVYRDFAGPVLEDQIDALHALAERYPLDLTRVGIRGWSFGGYLAALAVLRRPDVFHAAVVGAPVTDLRLYDTAYTERYLGDPNEEPDVYAASSVITDDGLSRAADVVRPMLIVHGLADDNVVVAHSLRLSSALLAAGRPHEMLPLSHITHMTTHEGVEANLMTHQVEFLTRALGPLVPRKP